MTHGKPSHSYYGDHRRNDDGDNSTPEDVVGRPLADNYLGTNLVIHLPDCPTRMLGIKR